MKSILLFSLVFLPVLALTPCTRSSDSNSTLGVFVGTSMCSDSARPLLGIPATAQCDRTKWDLTLYVDARTQSPTTYKLSSEYGYHIDNRTLVMKGSNVSEGKWVVTRGLPGDPNATVYQLDPGDPAKTLSFQRIDANIIHLLERDRTLTIGTAAQSFTLSKTNPQRTSNNSDGSALTKTPARLAKASQSALVFTGRTPCREVARQLNYPVGADCIKLKWALTLNQDPKTQTPTTFKLRGTLFRDYDREGTWAVMRGRGGEQNGSIFKLDLDKPKGSLLLFKADDNILFFLDDDGTLMVGNRDFSYTLNRDTSR
ncbi:MAG TPA: copper resistance protein NlpE N-terminal domain-containing protein [Pyrinomonadaceae bacterium]|nr:copper resistance protein NlpE N-terminal domain-containing protein [Pyrinomonadaceae bacterium]